MNSTTHYENANFLRELAESLPRIFHEGSTDKSALIATASLMKNWHGRNTTNRSERKLPLLAPISGRE